MLKTTTQSTGPQSNVLVHKVQFHHNNEEHTVKLNTPWLTLDEITRGHLLEYFKLCIDIGHKRGELTVKVAIN